MRYLPLKRFNKHRFDLAVHTGNGIQAERQLDYGAMTSVFALFRKITQSDEDTIEIMTTG